MGVGQVRMHNELGAVALDDCGSAFCAKDMREVGTNLHLGLISWNAHPQAELFHLLHFTGLTLSVQCLLYFCKSSDRHVRVCLASQICCQRRSALSPADMVKEGSTVVEIVLPSRQILQRNKGPLYILCILQ